MIARLLFWIVAAPLWCASALLAMLFLLSLLSAPLTASKNHRQKLALLKRAELIEDYMRTNGRLPSNEDFVKAASDLDDGLIYHYKLYTERPNVPEGFRFPEWLEGKQSYAIGYWRGEWHEFYDSNSRTTTLDETSRVSVWVKDAFWPLGAALVFGLPPFILRWFWKKRRLAKSLQAAPGVLAN